jgi:5'-3' exonuclease
MTTKEVLLIDHGSVFWAAWHSSVNDEVSAAHDRCVGQVRKLAGDLRAVAICCDSPRSIRREKHVEYKAQRPAKDHASIEELRRTKETLRREGFLIWEHDGYEADDVIAAAVAAAPNDCAITIASADKDLLQLVYDRNSDSDGCEGVRVVSTKTGAVLDEAAVRAKLGVPPSRVRDWLALVGDSSDNIAGVPGIGPVKAAALLNEFGSIEQILERLQNNVTHDLFKPAISAALRDPENLKNLVTAQYLVTLVDTLPVPFGEIFEERQAQGLGTLDADFDEPEAPVPAAAPNTQQALATTEQMPAVEGGTQYAENLAARNEISQAHAEARLVVASAPYEQQLQPDNLTAAWKLSGALFESRLYHRFGTRAAIFAVIIRGREMGLTALTSLDMFHVVEGKPSASAVLLISRAKAHPDCEYFRFIGGDRTYAEYETKSRQNPEPTRFRYTIDDAKLAGVIKGGSNWEKRPAEMLRKTCAVQLARIEYPEALGGLYSQEEIAA